MGLLMFWLLTAAGECDSCADRFHYGCPVSRGHPRPLPEGIPLLGMESNCVRPGASVLSMCIHQSCRTLTHNRLSISAAGEEESPKACSKNVSSKSSIVGITCVTHQLPSCTESGYLRRFCWLPALMKRRLKSSGACLIRQSS